MPTRIPPRPRPAVPLPPRRGAPGLVLGAVLLLFGCSESPSPEGPGPVPLEGLWQVDVVRTRDAARRLAADGSTPAWATALQEGEYVLEFHPDGTFTGQLGAPASSLPSNLWGLGGEWSPTSQGATITVTAIGSGMVETPRELRRPETLTRDGPHLVLPEAAHRIYLRKAPAR